MRFLLRECPGLNILGIVVGLRGTPHDARIGCHQTLLVYGEGTKYRYSKHRTKCCMFKTSLNSARSGSLEFPLGEFIVTAGGSRPAWYAFRTLAGALTCSCQPRRVVLVVGSIIAAIRASLNHLICVSATLQIIVPAFVIEQTRVDLHADASATTWVKLSQLSRMRISSSTGWTLWWSASSGMHAKVSGMLMG